MKKQGLSKIATTVEILILIAIVIFIRMYVFQFFRVSGISMCNTLNYFDHTCREGKGEFVFVNEFLYRFWRSPQRGEIVIVKPPKIRDYYIKRVVAVAGDTIDIKEGKVYISNEQVQDAEIEEYYLSRKNQGRSNTTGAKEVRTNFTVPKDYYLVFGDNRNSSLDARMCFSNAGCNEKNSPYLARDEIVGRAEFVIWPFWMARFLDNSAPRVFASS